jgi:hypothetical protein
VRKVEAEVDSVQSHFMSLIRERYQEELALGNKSRILSTYGTWALLVLNSLVFVFTQLVLEPRKKVRCHRMPWLMC